MAESKVDSSMQQERKKRKRKIWIFSVLGAIALVFIVIAIVGHAKVVSSYSEAEVLISEGQYEQAAELLEQLDEENYKDTKALIDLCDAHVYYESGYISKAHYLMSDALFRYQSDEQMAEISSFEATLKEEYDDYIAAETKRELLEYEEKITNGVPFVGMSESRINDTSLGKPSSNVRHNYEGKYLANLYDFYKDGKVIYTARCVKGKVTNVWDHRDNPQSSRSSSKSSGKTYDDGPSTDGFSDPEDFYDWYWDDFYDYEEAEDYYYSHGGE